ncbi:hypothetical protein F0L68_22170 [Solihabitans fulvus]|uniref:Uncharacterized protein n=1 Tax=Solihabitans fulvus TaxID=1892852 RepID=A0A5B2X5T8_9PSEU|nr:hypothetical protein F0L68_22170 [Solihabitans fulvus]
MVADVLWAHCTPADRVEHITVRTSVDSFCVVFFQLADSVESAESTAHSICLTAIGNSTFLHGWSLHRIRPTATDK